MRHPKYRELRGYALLSILVVVCAWAGTACRTGESRYPYDRYSTEYQKNSLQAHRQNAQGLALIGDNDLDAAEETFRASLASDLSYSPAHNNLGLVLLRKKRYYEAAWEFDCAAKLAPNATEPRENLALLYENLGRLDQAIEGYEAVLEIDPNDLVAMRHLARAYVRAGKKPRRLKELLESLLLIPSDKQWDVWVRGQIIRLGRSDEDSPLGPFGGR